MSSRHSIQAAVGRLFALGILLSMLGSVLPAAGEGQAPVASVSVYLPFMVKPGQLDGTITENGVLAAGVQVDLRFFDGASWSTRATAVTDSNGRYAFTVPGLSAGQRYYVLYLNETNPNRLGFWGTKDLTAYSSGTNASFANFDIANVVLASPTSDSDLYLPINFSWYIRPASPNDNFEFNLWDPIDDVVYYTNPLGHVNSYTLYNPPYVDQWYGWFVGVYANNFEVAPTDAYGFSYYFNWVWIWSDGIAADQLIYEERIPLAQMLPDMVDPKTDRPVRHPAGNDLAGYGRVR